MLYNRRAQGYPFPDREAAGRQDPGDGQGTGSGGVAYEK